MNKLTGTGVAMVTPFNADGSVDFDGLAKLTKHLIQGGIEFLVILGTTGESATLSAKEQEAVVEHILSTNAGKLPFVLGVGGNDTAKVAEKARDWSAKYRPDAFLSVSPYYNKPSQEGIYRHFNMVAAASDTPIILYNVPGRTASNMSAATTVRLAREIPHVIAMKEASGNFEQIMEIIRDKPEGFSVLSGDDAITLPMMACGADGVISVVANALPRQFSDMVRDCIAGDYAKARNGHYPLLKFTQQLFAEGNPAGIKAALAHLGICGEHVRLPLWPASNALSESLMHSLAEIG